MLQYPYFGNFHIGRLSNQFSFCLFYDDPSYEGRSQSTLKIWVLREVNGDLLLRIGITGDWAKGNKYLQVTSLYKHRKALEINCEKLS